MAKYEVTIYNQAVRDKVLAGEHHKEFTDDWADFRYIEILAGDANEARSRIEARYPPERGFVIDSVSRDQKQDYE